jgi:hypothetical protein
VCMAVNQMFDNDIRIRIAGEGLGFVYSVWHAGELITTAEVRAAGDLVCDTPEREVAPGYYGGSEAMD